MTLLEKINAFMTEITTLAASPTSTPEEVLAKLDEGINVFQSVPGLPEETMIRLYEMRTDIISTSLRCRELREQAHISRQTFLGNYIREYFFEKEPSA